MRDTFFAEYSSTRLHFDQIQVSARFLSFRGMCMYNTELGLTNTVFSEVIKEFTVMDGLWGINTQILLAWEIT